MEHYVYIHKCPLSNNIKYVGKGRGNRAYITTPSRRHAHHRNWLESLKNKNLNPIVKILEFFKEEKEAFRYERTLIKNMRKKGINLCNITDGGEGSSGLKGKNNPMYGKTYHTHGLRKWNKEKDIKGEKNPMYGKKRKDLAKYNSSKKKGKKYETLYGEKKAKELKEMASNRLKGKKLKPFTKEHRKNISKARKGKGKPKISVLCKNTGEIGSVNYFCQYYGYNNIAMYNHLRGETKFMINPLDGSCITFVKL
jgi:hypothetical protein